MPLRTAAAVICAFGFLVAVSPALAAAPGVSAGSLARKPDAWFKGDEARSLLANVLSYQEPAGGWCKAYDASAPRDPAAGKAGYGGWDGFPTIDNDATFTEVRLLARAAALTGRAEYRDAAVRGIDFLLARQYANGGWPQRSPLDGNPSYGAHVTFNDGAMVGVMLLLRDAAAGRGDFAFVDEARRAKAAAAFARGVTCILDCQIKVNGVPTAWCQQHDEKTLAPAGARAYELPSISGAESAGILKLLMDVEKPDDRVRRAVDAGCAWFERAKVTGKRVTVVDAPAAPKGKDKVVVDDPAAPPLWARFYEVETNRPFFCSRDGVKRYDLAEISHERRNGYAWYGNWGNDVLKAYPKWKARHEPAGK
ncbi:MAG TPA: pectate lyase [Humisphaera sp.]